MGNLFQQNNGTPVDWSIGFSPFIESGDPPSKVLVKCRIHNTVVEEWALLDTGSTYTVVSSELVQTFENQLIIEGPETIQTWRGPVYGQLARLDITLVAEVGQDLKVEEGLVLVGENWNGPVVLGYRGFLDKIRIAIDPGIQDGDQTFFFGDRKA